MIKILSECIFTIIDIEYLKMALPPDTDPAFLDYLKTVTTKDVKLYAIQEGTVVFPKLPLLRVEGPLAG